MVRYCFTQLPAEGSNSWVSTKSTRTWQTFESSIWKLKKKISKTLINTLDVFEKLIFKVPLKENYKFHHYHCYQIQDKPH